MFGAGYGLEHVNYFAPPGEPTVEHPSFRRSNAFAPVGEEVRAVRTAVGINEIHNFGKYALEGPDAPGWLSYVMAGRVPDVGRISLTPMLSQKGRLIGDFTIARLDPERFHLTASYATQAFHMRWFLEHRPKHGMQLRNVSLERVGFQIAGPNARELLARVANGDVSNQAMPFLSVRELEIALVPAMVSRLTYTGDLGYEIYVSRDHQMALLDALTEAGGDLGLRPFGMRAMIAAHREIVWRVAARISSGLHPGGDRPRPVHRLQQERLHRTRHGDGGTRSPAGPKARDPGGGRDRRGCLGRRTGVARRGGGWLRHFRRLCPTTARRVLRLPWCRGRWPNRTRSSK